MTEIPLEQEYAALLAACTNYKRRAEAAEAAIAQAVQAEREANRKPLEDAARQLRAVASYANTLPRRYAATLSSMIQYGEIEAAAIRARNGNAAEPEQRVRTIKRHGDVSKDAEKAYYSDEPPF